MIDPALSFEMVAMPHLPAAYNLARWLLRDEQNAEDVVQEAYLRAFRFFKDVQGDNVRPWLLGIVRNACFDWLAVSSSRTRARCGSRLAAWST